MFYILSPTFFMEPSLDGGVLTVVDHDGLGGRTEVWGKGHQVEQIKIEDARLYLNFI